MKIVFILLSTIAMANIVLVLAYLFLLHNSAPQRRKVWHYLQNRSKLKIGLIVLNIAACLSWLLVSLPMFDEVLFQCRLGLGHTEMINNLALSFESHTMTNKLQEIFVTKWYGNFDENGTVGQCYILFSLIGAVNLFGFKILKKLHLTT